MNIKLSEHDRELILALARERQRLRQEAAKITNERLAEKFGVTFWTIQRVTSAAGLGR